MEKALVKKKPTKTIQNKTENTTKQIPCTEQKDNTCSFVCLLRVKGLRNQDVFSDIFDALNLV